MVENFVTTTFENLKVGSVFRFQKEWYKKEGFLSFVDGKNYKRPAPKFFTTFVSTIPENCLIK